MSYYYLLCIQLLDSEIHKMLDAWKNYKEDAPIDIPFVPITVMQLKVLVSLATVMPNGNTNFTIRTFIK
jgi:hypothetical protein